MITDLQAAEKIEQLATENRGLIDSNRRMTSEVKRLQVECIALRAELADALVARDGFRQLLARARRGKALDAKIATKKGARRG